MNKKLYVGNLPYSVDDQVLQSEFEKFGQVESARVITDRETGRSKGFGFVEMSSEDEANNAIEKLNGQPMSGRNVTVSIAKPQAPRERGGFGGGGGRGGRGGGGNRSFGGRGEY